MKRRYLVVTFRNGRPVGYLYLARTERATVVRTTDEGRGVRADFDADGAPRGIEITRPAEDSADDVNAVLVRLGSLGWLVRNGRLWPRPCW